MPKEKRFLDLLTDRKMNCSVYIYGCFREGYSQFPENSTAQLLQKEAKLAIHKTQIITHREGNLMYYNYIRRLSGDKANFPQFIGFCILANGVIFNDIKKLFSIFESTFEKVAYGNEIIGIDDTGQMIPMCSSLLSNRIRTQETQNYLCEQLKGIENDCEKLPSISYSIVNTTVHNCTFTSTNAELVDCCSRFPYVIIAKNESINSPGLAQYLQRLSILYGKEQKKTHRSRKSIIWIVVFSLSFIITLIVLSQLQINK